MVPSLQGSDTACLKHIVITGGRVLLRVSYAGCVFWTSEGLVIKWPNLHKNKQQLPTSGKFMHPLRVPLKYLLISCCLTKLAERLLWFPITETMMRRALWRWHKGGGLRCADGYKLSALRVRKVFLGLYENHMLPFLIIKLVAYQTVIWHFLEENIWKFRQERDMNRGHELDCLQGSTCLRSTVSFTAHACFVFFSVFHWVIVSSSIHGARISL